MYRKAHFQHIRQPVGKKRQVKIEELGENVIGIGVLAQNLSVI